MFIKMQVIFMNTCFVCYIFFIPFLCLTFFLSFFNLFSTTISTEHQTLHHLAALVILFPPATSSISCIWVPSLQAPRMMLLSSSSWSRRAFSAWLDISSSSNCADSMQPSPWSPACQAAVFLCPEGTDICLLGCQSHSPLSFGPWKSIVEQSFIIGHVASWEGFHQPCPEGESIVSNDEIWHWPVIHG